MRGEGENRKRKREEMREQKDRGEETTGRERRGEKRIRFLPLVCVLKRF